MKDLNDKYIFGGAYKDALVSAFSAFTTDEVKRCAERIGEVLKNQAFVEKIVNGNFLDYCFELIKNGDFYIRDPESKNDIVYSKNIKAIDDLSNDDIGIFTFLTSASAVSDVYKGLIADYKSKGQSGFTCKGLDSSECQEILSDLNNRGMDVFSDRAKMFIEPLFERDENIVPESINVISEGLSQTEDFISHNFEKFFEISQQGGQE